MAASLADAGCGISVENGPAPPAEGVLLVAPWGWDATTTAQRFDYPEGPLALGDRIGPARVLAIREAMQALYGDPRYRPSIWLRRRADLGMPLGPDGG